MSSFSLVYLIQSFNIALGISSDPTVCTGLSHHFFPFCSWLLSWSLEAPCKLKSSISVSFIINFFLPSLCNVYPQLFHFGLPLLCYFLVCHLLLPILPLLSLVKVLNCFSHCSLLMSDHLPDVLLFYLILLLLLQLSFLFY